MICWLICENRNSASTTWAFGVGGQPEMAPAVGASGGCFAVGGQATEYSLTRRGEAESRRRPRGMSTFFPARPTVLGGAEVLCSWAGAMQAISTCRCSPAQERHSKRPMAC
jgi:membrane associated rhomboid family serine protease